MSRFVNDLYKNLSRFNKKNAEILSQRIHEAEVNDYELTQEEDDLWFLLAKRIVEINLSNFSH